jgi:hypothetical protein
MITVADLQHNPPPGLDEIEPYPPGTLEAQQADEGQAQALCDSLYLQDTDPDSFEAAVLVGKGAVAAAAELASLVPHIHHILILEPDARMIRTLQAELKNNPSMFPHAETTALGDVVDGAAESRKDVYSLDAYTEILQFLLCANTSMDRVLLFLNTDDSPASTIYSPLALAMEDLFWARSERFLDLIDLADTLPVELLSEWADFLMRIGQPFHAAKFYVLLAKHTGAEAMAQGITRAWVESESYAALKPWLSHLGIGGPEAGRANVASDVEECLAQQGAAAETCLAKNLATISERAPELARRLREHVPDPELFVARIDAVPWAISFRPPRISSRPYWVLFRVEASRVHEINPIGNPRQMLAILKPHLTTEDRLPAAVLMGSARRYGMLLCLHANLMDLKPEARTQSIYVTEHDLDVLAVLLRRVDLSDVLSDEGVAWFVGQDADDSLEQYLSPSSTHPLPVVRVDVPILLADRLTGISAARNETRSLPYA